MKKVFKYTLNSDTREETVLDIATGAEILDIQVQNRQPQLWVLIDPSETTKELRTFKFIGTGDEIDDNAIFVKTVLLGGGSTVLHLFELK